MAGPNDYHIDKNDPSVLQSGLGRDEISERDRASLSAKGREVMGKMKAEMEQAGEALDARERAIALREMELENREKAIAAAEERLERAEAREEQNGSAGGSGSDAGEEVEP